MDGALECELPGDVLIDNLFSKTDGLLGRSAEKENSSMDSTLECELPDDVLIEYLLVFDAMPLG